MRDSWLCEHDIGAIGASEPFKVCTEVHTFVRCCAAQHARVWSISARLHAEFRSITNKAGEGIRTERSEVPIPVAVRRTAALTSRSEGRESAASEGREAKPSVPERKAGEGIRTELCEVRIPAANASAFDALTSHCEGRESATSEGREAKPSVPERKAGEGIRTLDIRHGRPTLYH